MTFTKGPWRLLKMSTFRAEALTKMPWPWKPVFEITAFLKWNISYGQSYCSTLIGNHTWHMEWYHVWWPWLTSKRVARFVSDSWVSSNKRIHKVVYRCTNPISSDTEAETDWSNSVTSHPTATSLLNGLNQRFSGLIHRAKRNRLSEKKPLRPYCCWKQIHLVVSLYDLKIDSIEH